MKGLILYGRTGKFTWRMGATVLAAESVAVFFGALVARALAASQAGSSSGRLLAIGSGLTVLCLLGAALMRRPVGVTLGWLIQLATFAFALAVPSMLFVGLVFTALWVTCLVQGHRIDTMQARWAGREP